ncbi:ABC transporter substrate-binding protein [Pleurocapsales cyanobacterium LEGE 06147]|nr:ABC transporter substrate-binding protein [Pleurocapsales cyanobacterium LEGE 06147]
MKKEWLNFVFLAILVALLLIGCWNFVLAPASDKQMPVSIRLGGWGASPAEQTLLRQVLQDFEAKYPDIKVKHEIIADQYMDVIKTRLIGEAAPDVFYLDISEAPFLMSQNVLEPLDPYLTPEFDLADFATPLLESFRYRERLYGLPKDYSTLALFYNKQAFAAAGLTAPPRTWEELLTYAKQLTVDLNQDGRIDQYGCGVLPDLARQVYKIEAFGGQLVDSNGYAAFATEAALQGLQLLVDQYRLDRSSALPSDLGTNSVDEMFGRGKVAMIITGNWTIPYLNETFPDLEFGAAEVPSINNKPGTMLFTVAYVMNKQAEHKAEAWQLISYLTGKEGMQKWTSTGFALPTRQSVLAALGYARDPLRAPLIAGIDYATPWQGGKNLSIVATNFNNQLLSTMLGEQPLKQAMVRAQESANRQIRANE